MQNANLKILKVTERWWAEDTIAYSTVNSAVWISLEPHATEAFLNSARNAKQAEEQHWTHLAGGLGASRAVRGLQRKKTHYLRECPLSLSWLYHDG